MKKARLKEKHTKDNKKIEKDFSTKSKVITAILLLILLVGFYFLTDKLVSKKSVDTSNKESNKTINVREENSINYSDIDSIKEDSYYLLLDKSDDENNNMYDIYINNIVNQSLDSNKFYYIDLSKDENKKLVDKKSKLNDIKNIKVSDSTLLYVSKNDIKDKFEGGEKIIAKLSSYFIVNTSDSNSNVEK